MNSVIILEKLTGMGIAFGIIGYFIFREWNRHHAYMKQLERMTAEQLAELRRTEVEAEAEVKRQALGNFWYLRLAMLLLGGGIFCFVGFLLFEHNLLSDSSLHDGNLGYYRSLQEIYYIRTMVLIVIGAALGVFAEFIIELWWKQKIMRAEKH